MRSSLAELPSQVLVTRGRSDRASLSLESSGCFSSPAYLEEYRAATAAARTRACGIGNIKRFQSPAALTTTSAPYHDAAVVGSIVLRTSVILVAGKPLMSACF